MVSFSYMQELTGKSYFQCMCQCLCTYEVYFLHKVFCYVTFCKQDVFDDSNNIFEGHYFLQARTIRNVNSIVHLFVMQHMERGDFAGGGFLRYT